MDPRIRTCPRAARACRRTRLLLTLIVTCSVLAGQMQGVQTGAATRAPAGAPPAPVHGAITPSHPAPEPVAPATHPRHTAIHSLPVPGSRRVIPAGTSPVTYHGGPVVQNGTTYVIFWLPAGFHFEPAGSEPGASDTRYETLIQRYFDDVGGSSFFNVVTQYYDNATGYMPNSSQLGGVYADTTAYPTTPLADQDIQHEVSRAMLANGWAPGADHFYFVYTGYGVQSCDASGCSGTDYCGYHSAFYAAGIQPIIYANMPTVSSCIDFNGPAPNGDPIGDDVINATSHEHVEGSVDPVPDSGWIDDSAPDPNSQGEIGDKCATDFGHSNPDGSNVTLRGHPYQLQAEWSNASLSCVLSFGQYTAPTPSTYYVAPDGSDAKDCLSVSTACATIGHVLTIPGLGNTVQVAAGTYHEHVTLYSNVTIDGAGAGQTIIDGSGNGTPVTVPASGTDTIAGVTIQHGAAAYGGGIDNQGSLSVARSVMSGNAATNSGGGISSVAGASLALTNSTVSGNSASYGGGIFSDGGVLTLTNSTVGDNGATIDGGGISSADGATVALTGSTIDHNHAGYGGGIDTQHSALTITASTISNNSGGQGGGIDDDRGSLAILNSTISGNATTGNGGGIDSFDVSTVSLAGSTISSNTAAQYGGGLATFSPSAVSTRDTILARNTVAVSGYAPDCGALGASTTSQGYNLLGDNTGCTGLTTGATGDQAGTAAAPIDPGLGTLRNNGGPTQTMALLAGSPAIDRGNTTGCTDDQGEPVTTDQRGFPRPYPADGRCDVGAFEYGSSGGTSATIAVAQGWNLISLPLAPQGTLSAMDVLQGVLGTTGHVAALFQLSGGRWTPPCIATAGGQPCANDVSLQPGTGYLLYADHAGAYTEQGTVPASAPIWTLAAGWNLIAVAQGTPALMAATVLRGVLGGTGQVAAIFALSDGRWTSPCIVMAGGQPCANDAPLLPGAGYLLYTDQRTSYTPGTAGGQIAHAHARGTYVAALPPPPPVFSASIGGAGA